jgi:hypothetical protein
MANFKGIIFADAVRTPRVRNREKLTMAKLVDLIRLKYQNNSSTEEWNKYNEILYDATNFYEGFFPILFFQ